MHQVGRVALKGFFEGRASAPLPDNWLVTNIRQSDNTRDNRQPSVTLSRGDETQAWPWCPRSPNQAMSAGPQPRLSLADPVCVLAIIRDDDYGYETQDPGVQTLWWL